MTITEIENAIQSVFHSLLSQGNTTTLDVKLELRKIYPTQYWTQDLVSHYCSMYQKSSPQSIGYTDNGAYREYYFISSYPTKNQSNQSRKTYSYTSSTGVTVSSDSPQILMQTAKQLGDTIHYSKTKDKFEPISLIQENHLLNIIFKETGDLDPNEYAYYIQESPYIKELITRYPV